MPTVLGKLLARSGLHDLGMHTELCSDAYLDLYEAGVLTNRRCTLHRGQGMLGIVLGSKRLYDWVDDNPGVIAAPLSYVNAPEVIAQLDNMVSINSCIAADLYGQVASESSGLRQISGTGGQLDFLTGAAMARGGKAFICMTSTFTDKQGVRHSRILPHFGGDIVTSPRSQAYYLATEYGVVNLAGRSTWERAEALVSIAHPDFRERAHCGLPSRRRSGGAARNAKTRAKIRLRGYRFHLCFPRVMRIQWSPDKGVIGAIRRAARPTTDPLDLARSEMMRLICP